MGGVIGATSGKFIMVGASLLLRGGVDDERILVAIVPGAPTSAVSTALAGKVKSRSNKPDLRIHLRAESFRARIDSVEITPAADADVRIGEDLLDGHPIEIDFAHHELQPLSPSEARQVERRSVAIPVRREEDGSLSVELAIDGQPSARALLDLSSTSGVSTPGPQSGDSAKIGTETLRGIEITEGPRPMVGLYAFRHARVIFDLANDRIWVRT